MIKFCYLCQTPLTNKNSSLEHVIPNALGGKLKATILCKKCNNDSGSFCDNSLAKSLSPFSNMINHSRDHGKVQPEEVTVDGVSTKILPGGQGFLSKYLSTKRLTLIKYLEAKILKLKHKDSSRNFTKDTKSLQSTTKKLHLPYLKILKRFKTQS